MLDSIPLLGGASLDTSRSLLVQAILTLDEAHNTQQNSTASSSKSSSSTSTSPSFYRNIKTALDRLAKLHILLFGPTPSEEDQDFIQWLSDNRDSLQQFLGERSNSGIDEFLAQEKSASCGVIGSSKGAGADSPPQLCNALLLYQPASKLKDELDLFRRLAEKHFTLKDGGIPRGLVVKLAALEKQYSLTRDQTTDSVWNVDHQVSRIEVLLPSDVGKVFRQKCQCTAKGDKIEHSQDVYCPKNKKDEDTPVPESANPKSAEVKSETAAPAEEKTDPSEKIHSKELMAEILDMIGPQHVKDHFQKIKDAVSASYKDENPWEGKYFGAVLMGPASTGKEKIAKRYGKYLISCGIAKDSRIEREASYIIENDKLEEYFRRLGDDGGVLTIENAHLLVSYKHKDKLALNYLLEQVEKKKGKITLILHGEEPELREFLRKNKKTPLFPHVLALNEFKGEDALTILRSGMENWFGEKTEVEGGWDGLYMRIAARRIAKLKDVEVTEAVGTLVKQIYQRQRKRINEARQAKGESSDKMTKQSSNDSSKVEKAKSVDSGKADSEEIITPEAAPNSAVPEVDRVRATKAQESHEKASSSEEVPKPQGRVSTISVSTTSTSAPSITVSEIDKSKDEASQDKLKSAEEVQKLLKQNTAEESKDKPVVDTVDDDVSNGQSTPLSESETPEKEVEVEKSEQPVKSISQEVAEEPPPANTEKEEAKPEEATKPSLEDSPAQKDAEKKQSEASDLPEQSKLTDDSTTEKSGDADKLSSETSVTTQESGKEEVVDASKEWKDAKDDSASSDGSESDSASETSEGSDATDITTPDSTEEQEDPEDFLFTKDDILGPAPSNKVLESEAWKKLQKLTGLKKVKDSLLNFLELAKANYHRELQEKPLLEFTFNKLFLGPPGTGKTVVAKLYGEILAEIGVLSKGDLVVKQAGDLIGKYIGDSETNTKEALKEATGGVLVIDEAYMLYTSDGVSNTTDCFRQGIIDTLVGGIQSVPGEDRCVLLLGYEEQMKNFLTESNPGLLRRFPLEEAFLFEEFTLSELKEILLGKLEEYGLEATPEAIKTAMSVLDKARARINFGNGGAVENLITKAKSACLARIIALPEEDRPDAWQLSPYDFDPECDRIDSATSNLQKLFSDVVGCEEIIEKFEHYQLVCQAMKERDMDPKGYIPTNFIFKGPPGTGKTTTARKIAQIYYDMGFLSEATVVECSVTDLIGRYIGQTGPKTAKALERGLGKVLFIDEAYRLAEGGRSSYAHEAVSELVDCLTKPKFFGKIIVILAGYEDEMNALLAMNPGLASRFPEEIMFDILPPAGCLEVLKKKLQETNIEMPLMEKDEDCSERQQLERLLRSLAQTPSWGNARDVETLAKNIARKVFVNGMLKKKKDGKEDKKKEEEKRGEAKKAEVKTPALARARPKEGEAVKEDEPEKTETAEDKKKDEEKAKADHEKKEDEKKVPEIKKLECDLATATAVMQEMLTERKARAGSEPPMGMFT